MRITLYRLRAGTILGKAVLRDARKFKEIAVAPASDDISWKLFAQQGISKKASWVENVVPILRDASALDRMKTQSSAGVLLAKVSDRVFALTFGHGHHAIQPHFIEQGFGVRATANIIAVDKITSADTKGFSRSPRSQKTILSSASELHALGIEPAEEWVRQLSGKVEAQDFATTAAGADSLHLTIKGFSLTNLPEKLAQINIHADSQAYKTEFGFLDNFIRLERREPIVAALDDRVEQLVASKDSSLGFAAPDPFDQLKADHYIIKYHKKHRLDELAMEDVYAALATFNVPGSVLHKVRIAAFDDEGKPVDKIYKLYDYLQAEIDHDGGRYALTSGAWFRIDKDYLKEIEEFVSAMSDISHELPLPDWDKHKLNEDDSDKTAEGSYNMMTAKTLGYELLDKKNLHFGQYRKIEICDLLTSKKQLLCVKQAPKSSTLSHLFAQASVSASLMHTPNYQERIMQHLKRFDTQAVFGAPSNWTFVYAIAIDKPGPLAKSLFFFSKVNLVTHARDIESRGFKVALAGIEMV